MLDAAVEGPDAIGTFPVDGFVKFCFALLIISSCLTFSFAKIGTRSLGTSVFNMKLSENFFSSRSLDSRSLVTISARFFFTLSFSVDTKFLNVKLTSFSICGVSVSLEGPVFPAWFRPGPSSGSPGLSFGLTVGSSAAFGALI